ncbi:phage protease [Hephaestia caeni]|nr:phage protease [Hephaestia caeni]
MTAPSLALCAAQPIADGDSAPEWLHLLPAGAVATIDGRGPYRVPDASALMAASLPAGEKIVLDENHATDLAAPNGGAAPARGWIVELQQRAGGIWGRVEWTGAGRKLAEDKAYRGVSPVIAYRKDGVITRILRASLTNTPNLKGLVALHQEENLMDLKARLIEALGLDSTADDDAIIAAVKAKPGAGDAATALQSALAPIAKAAGLAETADAAAVLVSVEALAAKPKHVAESDAVVALQSEIGALTTKLNALTEDGARTAATRFVDDAIAAGRVGVKPLRDDYIAMHMEDATRTEKMIGAMPVIKGARIVGEPPKGGAKADLGEADASVIALMGLDPEEYRKTRAATGADQEEAL